MPNNAACKTVTAFAPATVANVACAFDVFGFALSAPGDEVTVTVREKPGVEVLSISGDDGRLPKQAEKNTAAVAIAAFLKKTGIANGVNIDLKKNMPLGSGLGSSAASAVAGVVAVNALFGTPLATVELLPFVMEGERVACGAAHADNVAPSLLGGFVLIRSYDPLDTVKIDSPAELFATVIHPHIEIRTEDARRILKKDIPLKSAVIQWGNTAGLIAGLLKSDYGLIGRSLHDVIIEPERALLIPGFDQVKQAALSAGALGCSISGSGPSIFALSRGKSSAEKAGSAMEKAFSAVGIGSETYISAVNDKGAYVISQS